MSIESRNSVESQSVDQKSNEILSAIAKQFFEVNASFWFGDYKAKEVEYGGQLYQDNTNEVYVPLDKDMKICNDYNGKFRDDQSSYLCVIKRSKSNGKIKMNIHDKGVNAKLNKKSLILSSQVITDPETNQKKYVLDSHSKDLSKKEWLGILWKLSKYLKTYFDLDPIEMQAKKQEAIDDIRIQEIISEESEPSPDDILEKLWAEEGL